MADRGSRSGQGLPSGTVTFLFTDIEGSTARWEHQPEAMRVALARHDALLRAAIVEHHGHVVKTMGDAFHAAFARAPDALAAAMDAQRRLQAESWGEVGPIRVRMALHTGAAEERDGDYYGPALNRAARLVGIGHGGQILLSEATAALVRDDLPAGASLLDLGQHRLKDLTEPERVSQVVAPGLPSDFPPLASLDARPNNLPTHPTALLGRERELAEVRKLFGEGARLVTLTGPGGTGKTRLGLQVAADLLDAFEHGAFLVELAPISDPELVPSTIAQALGVRDIGSRPIVDSVKEYLRARSALLLLDNFEQILLAASVVADLLAACPGLAVLTTSREPLRLRGEHEYAVLPLALPGPRQATTADGASTSPAVALFVQRAHAIRADFALTNENAPAIAEICARLDGLPLAIELAAARTKLLTPQAMMSRLERRLPFLAGGARDLPARQRALRDTIAWSYDLLNETDRRIFRRSAVFVNGFSLEGMEAVCVTGGYPATVTKPAPDIDILDRAASLVDKSLLRQRAGPDGEPRFSMLETVQEYGLEQLAASGESSAIRRRHLTWLAGLAECGMEGTVGPDAATWYDRLEAELDNIRAALAWSLSDPDPASTQFGLRIAGDLSRLWRQHNHLAEGRRWLEQTLAADERRLADRRLDDRSEAGLGSAEMGVRPGRTGAAGANPRVVALLALAYLHLQLGHLEPGEAHAEGAISLAEEAISLARDAQDRVGESSALVARASIARRIGEYEQAAALAEESLAVCRTLDHPFTTWRVTINLGETVAVLGDYSRARALLEESLSTARSIGFLWGVAQALRLLGVTAYHQGDFDRAVTLLDESLSCWRQLPVSDGPHRALWEHGLVALARGDPRQAATSFAECLKLSFERADRQSVAQCLQGLAVAAAYIGPEQDGWSVRVAQLLGRAESALESTSRPLIAIKPRIVEAAARAARADLGDDTHAAAWAEGRAMTLEQAVASALDEPPSA